MRTVESLVEKSRDVTLLEVLDRVLHRGVVLVGEVTISVADVDLIYLQLRVLLSSVETVMRERRKPRHGDS
ncbi:MAG: gas vesicle protein [Planctomycetes bacterium]|nr:gas vesicle protein [Planctomycetota bacterium]